MSGKEYSPRLDTVFMVENFIKAHSGMYRKRRLWERLPKKIMYQNFCSIIDYLIDEKKIRFDGRKRIQSRSGENLAFAKDRWFLFQEVPGWPNSYSKGPMVGFIENLEKNCGTAVQNMVYYCSKQNLLIYAKEKEWHLKGLEVFEKIASEPKFVKWLVKEIHRRGENLRKVSRKLQKINPEKISNKELYKHYALFFDSLIDLWDIGMAQNLPDFENEYPAKYLLEWVRKKAGQLELKENKTEMYSIIVTPTEKSLAQREELELLRLASVIKKNASIRNRFIRLPANKLEKEIEKYPKIYRKIVLHENKYCWLAFNWTGPEARIKHYLERIRLMLSNKVNLAELINCLEKYEKNIQEKQKKYLTILRPDKKTRTVIYYSQSIAECKVYRLDVSYYGFYSIEPFLIEIGRRMGLALSQVRAVCPEQMKKVFLDKRIPVEEINIQFNDAMYLAERGKSSFLIGRKAVKKHKEILKNLRKQKKKDQLRGTPAYPGIVTGKVKIINRPSELSKMNKGDVMVSVATSPDLIRGMKKASAILTDVGGITCHAAIVSRELQIPCIIGLKAVTKNFLDGDIVEVDANHGIVKKVQ